MADEKDTKEKKTLPAPPRSGPGNTFLAQDIEAYIAEVEAFLWDKEKHFFRDPITATKVVFFCIRKLANLLARSDASALEKRLTAMETRTAGLEKFKHDVEVQSAEAEQQLKQMMESGMVPNGNAPKDAPPTPPPAANGKAAASAEDPAANVLPIKQEKKADKKKDESTKGGAA